jgi:hypothetical protein
MIRSFGVHEKQVNDKIDTSYTRALDLIEGAFRETGLEQIISSKVSDTFILRLKSNVEYVRDTNITLNIPKNATVTLKAAVKDGFNSYRRHHIKLRINEDINYPIDSTVTSISNDSYITSLKNIADARGVLIGGEIKELTNNVIERAKILNSTGILSNENYSAVIEKAESYKLPFDDPNASE